MVESYTMSLTKKEVFLNTRLIFAKQSFKNILLPINT